MTQVPRTEGARSGAARLRADLTHLLTEHVYLTGLRARETRTANATALAEVIGGLYGQEAGRRFAAVWRDGTAAEIGAFVHSTVPALSAASVTAALESATPEASHAEALRVAAGHMQATAGLLARGIVAERRAQFTGSTAAGASVLRSRLAALLTGHVYLTAARERGDRTAALALARNTAALEALITPGRAAEALRREPPPSATDPMALRAVSARMARHAEFLADTMVRESPKRFPSA